MTVSQTLRPDPGSDSAAWTREVFHAGDYAGAAYFGDSTTLEHLASHAILTGDASSILRLGDCSEVEAKLHHAAALFIHGHDDHAIERLREIAPKCDHARNLLKMLRQPKIRVLSQLPWFREARTGMPHAGSTDPRFEIRNVGYRQYGDIPNQPYASVHGFVSDGFRPNFYLCAMVEWHHLPPDLATLPCPILGHIADHDLHIQALQPWLAAFDELLVTDRSEWLDVQGLAQRPGRAPHITSFPKSFGITPGATLGLHEPSRPPRPLDFFVSGTMLDPYHPDKAARLQELLSIEDIKMRVIQGFAGQDAYEGLLAASKVSFSFVRRPGAMPTRALEALGMGCAVATQEESIFNLFAGHDEGVATYDATAGSLARCVRQILDNWDDHFQAAALRGAAKIRREFQRDRVTSQYLRYAAFRAAAPRDLREPVDLSRQTQKRLCARRAPIAPCAIARKRTMQANYRFLQTQIRQSKDAATLNDMARELLLEFAYWVGEPEQEKALFDDALELLKLGCRQFPDNLVLHFNRIRSVLEFGSDSLRSEAMQLAFDTLSRPPESWSIEPDHDVLAFDVGAEAFNYRDYYEAVASYHRGQESREATNKLLVRLIRASIAGYFARKTGKVDTHALAAVLDPDFARYAYDWARALLDEDPTADATEARTRLQQAAEILEKLVSTGSTHFLEASELLETLRLRPDAPTISLSSETLSLPVSRIRERSLDTSIALAHLKHDTSCTNNLAITLDSSIEVGVQRGTTLAVLVPFAGNERELSDLFTDIQSQTIAHSVEIYVALPDNVQQLELLVKAHDRAPCKIQVVRVSLQASFAEALNACVAAASSAPLLTIASPGCRRRADAFDVLTATLDDSRTDVVFANEGRSEGAATAFDSDLCAKVLCHGRYSTRRMFATNELGFHAVWRSSLHPRFGTFDLQAGAATEYDFWLRVVPHIEVRQRSELLTISPDNSPWLALRDSDSDSRATRRARSTHWPEAWGPLPFARAARPLPAALFNPSMVDEATSHRQLGMIPPRAHQEVVALQSIYGTALIHRDLETAERMLRTAVSCFPTLLSARALHARILESMDLQAVPAALEHVLACNPYPAAAHRIVGHACARTLPAGATEATARSLI